MTDDEEAIVVRIVPQTKYERDHINGCLRIYPTALYESTEHDGNLSITTHDGDLVARFPKGKWASLEVRGR